MVNGTQNRRQPRPRVHHQRTWAAKCFMARTLDGGDKIQANRRPIHMVYTYMRFAIHAETGLGKQIGVAKLLGKLLNNNQILAVALTCFDAVGSTQPSPRGRSRHSKQEGYGQDGSGSRSEESIYDQLPGSTCWPICTTTGLATPTGETRRQGAAARGGTRDGPGLAGSPGPVERPAPDPCSGEHWGVPRNDTLKSAKSSVREQASFLADTLKASMVSQRRAIGRVQRHIARVTCRRSS
ncbi:hypothetical protein N657DRAFT_710987 [Parathielavia appendiculata]|uniref:Uncharacterized protein n=1 Tax=Parathielavia appendiculata TaxID=2587402 RepID=A0AAN6YZ61_9PEZI|nr:hypothetical protein N657DRAFT_710987 [Parathielavia appendiculata]